MENHLIDVLVKPFGIQMAMSIYQGACHETFNFSLSVDSNHTGVQFGKVCNIQATVHQVALNAGIPGAVCDFGRSSLPRRTSRLAATWVQLD